MLPFFFKKKIFGSSRYCKQWWRNQSFSIINPAQTNSTWVWAIKTVLAEKNLTIWPKNDDVVALSGGLLGITLSCTPDRIWFLPPSNRNLEFLLKDQFYAFSGSLSEWNPKKGQCVSFLIHTNCDLSWHRFDTIQIKNTYTEVWMPWIIPKLTGIVQRK